MASPHLHHRKLQGSQNNILHEFKMVQNDVILNEQLTLGQHLKKTSSQHNNKMT